MSSNREMRTRKDLLRAANRLLEKNGQPSMDEVAAEALVSRATAYRYFPSVDALLVEAVVDAAIVDPDAVFAGDTTTDPEVRIVRAEATMHEASYRNEARLRVMLAHSMTAGSAGKAAPRRQNRRMALIDAALAPARERFTATAYKRLCSALALVFGTESMIVFKDVLRVDERTARHVKQWAVRVLVRAALAESASTTRSKSGLR